MRTAFQPSIVASMLFVWILVSCLITVTLADKALAGVQIDFPDLKDSIFVTYSATLGEPAPKLDDALETTLYSVAKNQDGCGSTSLTPPNNARSWTLVVARGGSCTFRDKVLKAQSAGAKAVIIVNTVAGLYNSTDGLLMNACSLNCDIGFGDSAESCEAMDGCFTCAENRKKGSGEFCCVDDSLIDMYVGKGLRIPAFFAGIEDGQRVLLPGAKAKANCLIYERPTYEIDPSLYVIGILGCSVLALASYRAASKERSLARWIWSPTTTQEQLEILQSTHEDADQEQLHLSVGQVWGFVLSSTCVLVTLFFLVQYYPHTIVRILQLLFAVGATGALAKLVIIPLLKAVLGPWASRSSKSGPSCLMDEQGETTFARTFGSLVAAVIAITWLIFRHASWSWIVLDILAASLATSFLITVRVPSLRVATALLTAFFFYDIFMVFITPAIFSGRSVMVDVATAGRAREEADAFTCKRQAEEQVPMLFSVPRFDWYGGYSLLGLGDIVLPGLLVVLAIRFDYAKLRYIHRDYEVGTTPFPKPSFSKIHSYYIPVVIAYCIGLSITFMANIRGWTIYGVRGQPALLYLVPTTLGTFLTLAWARGDFATVWSDDWAEWEMSGIPQMERIEEVERDMGRRTPSL